MQAELLNQDLSSGEHKSHRVRVKKKVRVRIKLDSRKEKAVVKRKERAVIFLLVAIVLAFVGALIMMVYSGMQNADPEQTEYID